MKDKNVNLQGKHGAKNCITLLQIRLDIAENDRHNIYSLFEREMYKIVSPQL